LIEKLPKPKRNQESGRFCFSIVSGLSIHQHLLQKNFTNSDTYGVYLWLLGTFSSYKLQKVLNRKKSCTNEEVVAVAKEYFADLKKLQKREYVKSTIME
jgi:hypothetical protein